MMDKGVFCPLSRVAFSENLIHGSKWGLTSSSHSGKSNTLNMARWKIKPSSLVILGSVIFVMLLIVVLPDVDLLDTAFQRGTAPIAVHAQGTSAPAAVSIFYTFRFPHTDAAVFRHFRGIRIIATDSPPNFLPILLRSLRR